MCMHKRRCCRRGLGHRDGQSGKAKGRSPVGPWPVNASDRQDRAPALRWGEVVHPIRPKTFARNHTIPHKVTDVSIYDKGLEKSRLRKLRPMIETGGARTEVTTVLSELCAPPGVVMVAPPEVPRNAKAALPKEGGESAANDMSIIRAGAP